MKDERSLLRHAIEIAEEGIKKGGGPFGAVIARNGKIISEAFNRVVLNHDPTAHAEILAIRDASMVLKSHNLSECVIFTSCEPCPMCFGAIYWSGIKRVVYGSGRKEAADSGFSDSVIYDEITLDAGKRKIDFIKIPDAGGEEVFKKWNEFENRIPY